MGGDGMVNLLEWKLSYSVGVKDLDHQHETLLGLINELAGKNPDQGAKRCFVALNEMVRYAQLHFNTEEELMKRHGFPRTASQQAEHEAFVTRVFELNQELVNGHPEVFASLIAFLKDWFISHVLGMDREYIDFFQDKEVT